MDRGPYGRGRARGQRRGQRGPMWAPHQGQGQWQGQGPNQHFPQVPWQGQGPNQQLPQGPLNVNDEVNEPVNLQDYLIDQENPNWGPEIFADEEAVGEVVAPRNLENQENEPPPAPPVVILPQGERLYPPEGEPHDHLIHFCPHMWQPPSLRPIIRQPGRTAILERAGIWNFIKFNFPTVEESFISNEFRDFTWSPQLQRIVIEPTVNGERLPRKIVDIACLQRLWPGLPSITTHCTPEKPLYQAPHFSNMRFWDQMDRYFFFHPYHRSNAFIIGNKALLDNTFDMPLYRFLLRLGYLFGWQGYSFSIPVYYLPMAVLTFATGKCYPWADLIMTHLIKDVRRRRQCPRLIFIWKTIWHFMLNPAGGPPAFNPEKRYNYVNYLFQCRNANIPCSREDEVWGPHYHMHEVSPYLPPSFRASVEAAACWDQCNDNWPYPAADEISDEEFF